MVLDKFIREAAGHFIWLLNILFVWFGQHRQHQQASAQTCEVGLPAGIPEEERRAFSLWFEGFVGDAGLVHDLQTSLHTVFSIMTWVTFHEDVDECAEESLSWVTVNYNLMDV